MQIKKLIPYIILAVLFVIALGIRQYRSEQASETGSPATNNTAPKTKKATESKRSNLDVFRDPEAEYFFTKHARCRMACRNITQKEVKEIVRKADVNYNKSDLDAAQGPRYAVEGYTARDRQHIRVIVAPKQRHLSIVTVIDLDKDWECPSCQ